MTKADLVDLIAKQTGIARVKAELVVNTIFDSITEALVKGDRVELRGFGSFTIKEYKAYNGRNPRTGEVIKVDAKKLPCFKVGKLLKDAVNNEK